MSFYLLLQPQYLYCLWVWGPIQCILRIHTLVLMMCGYDMVGWLLKLEVVVAHEKDYSVHHLDFGICSIGGEVIELLTLRPRSIDLWGWVFLCLIELSLFVLLCSHHCVSALRIVNMMVFLCLSSRTRCSEVMLRRWSFVGMVMLQLTGWICIPSVDDSREMILEEARSCGILFVRVL